MGAVAPETKTKTQVALTADAYCDKVPVTQLLRVTSQKIDVVTLSATSRSDFLVQSQNRDG